ncbi:PT domain-containing protein [Dactylosporangium sp. NPDC049140]|uniref:PT domain-containing protein n=1 Tax=Dactylosporangium sp. NPDC049140 TaxID=3155647 RepID=UPI00340E1255
MSIRRTRRITAATAERLLADAGSDRIDDQHHLLAAVLAASAGPAQPAELIGRRQAVAGFRTAQLHPAPPQRRQSVIKTALVKLLTVKAATVAVLAVGAGGVALAATTGALPNPLNSHANPAASAGDSHLSARPSASEHGPGNANPSPSLVGLCHAYTAGAGAEHGKALENPAFGALITAAGGKDKVDAYCAKLLATSASESARPGGQPSEHPTGAPTNHPTGAPTSAPTNHSTGRPSPQPSH